MLLLAIPAGLALGYVLERGDLCFHSTLRGLLRQPREVDLFRAYLFAMLLSAPALYALRAFGLIDPWVPPFAWLANILGGTMFGIGMVVASTCITGLFYKTGHGMLGAIVGLVGWFIGDVVTYIGPLSPLRATLRTPTIAVAGNAATVYNIAGAAPGIVAALLVGALLAVWLWRSPAQVRGKHWNWRRLGLVMAVLIPAAWLLAHVGGSNYPYGTSSIPTQIVQYVAAGMSGDGSPWVPLALAGLIPGAFVAALLSGTLWVRGEAWRRYVELGLGGLIMGVGAGIAGGCNLGHSLIGVPLLSLGSITSTASMALGVWIAHHAARVLSRRRAAAPAATGA